MQCLLKVLLVNIFSNFACKTIDQSTTPALIDVFKTWNNATNIIIRHYINIIPDPTTKNKKRPSTMGPTGIFSSFF